MLQLVVGELMTWEVMGRGRLAQGERMRARELELLGQEEEGACLLVQVMVREETEVERAHLLVQEETVVTEVVQEERAVANYFHLQIPSRR